MRRVFPRLRQYCAEKDFDLNCIDLHFGVASDVLDMHDFREICLNKIRQLKATNTLIVLVSGFRSHLREAGGRCPIKPTRTTYLSSSYTQYFLSLSSQAMHQIGFFILSLL